MSVKSWEVSDAFWEIVEPLIPKPKRDREKQYKRNVGGGRKPLDPRAVFPLSFMFCEPAFSGRPCQQDCTGVRALFTGISGNGSK